jgi:hypothetical protein
MGPPPVRKVALAMFHAVPFSLWPRPRSCFCWVTICQRGGAEQRSRGFAARAIAIHP